MKLPATLSAALMVLMVGVSIGDPPTDATSALAHLDPQALHSHGPYLEEGTLAVRAGIQAINGTTLDCGHGMNATPLLDAGPDSMLLHELDAVLKACWAQILEPLAPSVWRNTLVARSTVEQGKAEEVAKAYIADAVLAIRAASDALGVTPGSVAEVEAQAFLMKRLASANGTLRIALASIEAGGFQDVHRVEEVYDNLESALADAHAIRHVAKAIPWSDGSCKPPQDVYARTRQQMDAAVQAAAARDTAAEDTEPLAQFFQDDTRQTLAFFEERGWWPGALAILYEVQVSEAGWKVPPLSYPNEIPWGLAVRMMDTVLEHNRTLFLEHQYAGTLAAIEDPAWQSEVKGYFAAQLLGAATPNPFLTVCA